MSDTKITQFSFSDVEEQLILSRDDFKDGDKIKFRQNLDGEILKMVENTYKDDNGTSTTTKSVLGFVTKDNIKCVMKLNPKTLKNLRAVSQDNITDLLNKTFSVTIEGTNQYKHVVLRLG